MLDKETKKTRKKEFLEKIKYRKKEARTVRRIVFVVTVIGFILIAGGIFWGYKYITKALEPADPNNTNIIEIVIPYNSGTTKICNILEENGIVKNAKIFKYYLKFNNESGFQAGTYKLSPSMKLSTVTDTLKSGSIGVQIKLKFTIPEGKNLEEISKIIAEKTGRTSEEVLNQINSVAFVSEMQTEFPEILSNAILATQVRYPLEGYLFPATYSFASEKPEVEEIVREMLKKTTEVMGRYSELMAGTDPVGEVWTVHEVLTLASIIEEESNAKSDRAKVAACFENRMSLGMKLESDATTLYAINRHTTEITRADLDFDSPYNTRKSPGIMPGPIAAAGEASIAAVLTPDPNKKILFFYTIPSSNETVFAETNEQHEKNTQIP